MHKTTNFLLFALFVSMAARPTIAVADETPAEAAPDRYWQLGAGCYFGGLGDLTELDVARYDWVMVCFGNISSNRHTTELLNRLLAINPDLKFMIRLWPGIYAEHPPGKNKQQATFLHYMYTPGVKQRVDKELSRQVRVVLDHIDKPENVIGLTFMEELPFIFGGTALHRNVTGTPIQQLSPAMDLFRKEIEAERGKPLYWDDETRRWWGRRWSDALGEIHATMKTASDGRLVFYWLQTNHSTLDGVPEGASLERPGLMPHYWSDVIKPGLCDGFFAYPNNEPIWQQYVNTARRHNWPMFLQLSHPGTMRLGPWDTCVRLAKTRTPQNLGYFFYCSGYCASLDNAGAWNIDPAIPHDPAWHAGDPSEKLHMRRHLAQEDVGMDIVRRQPAFHLDVDLPLNQAQAGGYLKVRAVARNVREPSFFLNPGEAVLHKVAITLEAPAGFTHKSSGISSKTLTLPIESMEPGEWRVGQWYLTVPRDFDGTIHQPFVITARADGTVTTEIRADRDMNIDFDEPRTARNGTQWLAPGYRLPAREVRPRIVIEALQGGVRDPGVGNQSARITYRGVLNAGQRLVLDPDGPSRLFTPPLVEDSASGRVSTVDPSGFSGYISGYMVASLPARGRIRPGQQLRLSLAGKAEGGAQSQLVLRYRTPTGTTDQAVLVNRFATEWREITDEVSVPVEAVALENIYFYRRNGAGTVWYGPLKIERVDTPSDGVDVSDRLEGTFPVVLSDQINVMRYTDSLPAWTADRVRVQLVAP